MILMTETDLHNFVLTSGSFSSFLCLWYFFCYILYFTFSELSLMGLALDLVN